MRLLNVNDLQLDEYDDNNVPPYAILSHRWEKEEVTFRDMERGTAERKAGYTKLTGACNEARNRGHAHIWIDTCCIDKSSSAELSEAINSMFRWYQCAVECLVYLCDVSHISSLAKSQWFSRGWTLQELIAPKNVKFYTNDWTYLGDRFQLVDELVTVTGIPTEIMVDHSRMTLESVAARMSWAARRKTTRIEDSAYSLMGIFDVNMPLLYGEGAKAFLRLQQEIIKQSDDTSILLWNDQYSSGSIATKLFATSPADFAHLLHSPSLVTALRHARTWKCARPPFALTNTGLSIELQLLPWTRRLYFALLPDLVNSRGLEDPNQMPESQCLIPLKFNPDANAFERICIQHFCIQDFSSVGTVLSEIYRKPRSYLGDLKFDEDAKGKYGEPEYQFSYTHDLALRRITIATQPLANPSNSLPEHACALSMQNYLVRRCKNGSTASISDRTTKCTFTSRFGVNHVFGAVYTRLFSSAGTWSIFLAFDADFYPIILLSDSDEVRRLFSRTGTQAYVDWRMLRKDYPGRCYAYHLKTVTQISLPNENFFMLFRIDDSYTGPFNVEIDVRYKDEAERLLQNGPRGRASSPSQQP